MRVLITGSRDWVKRGPVEVLLAGLSLRGVQFVFGDCPTGVDALAWEICLAYEYDHKRFLAEWDKYGNPAGPIRNGVMVRYCLEVPQRVCYGIRSEGISKGTDDCLEQARQAGIPTYLIRTLPPYAGPMPGTKGYRYNSEVEGP